MSEILTIKNFGPIKNAELEFRKVNILIGSQGSGKSTIVKLFASLQSLLYSTGAGASTMMQVSQLNSIEHFKKHLSVYEIDSYLNPESIIKLTGGKINFKLENETIYSNLEELIHTDFLYNNEITYIPADRIATSLFSEATWPDLIDITDGKVDMPKYFLRFFSLFNRIKKKKNEFDFTGILDVKFKYENGIDKIILNNGIVIPIAQSSSAIHSNLSLLAIIDWQTQVRAGKTRRNFIIEEPELNLFPVTQNILIKFLVERIKNNNDSLFLTTHSPYILTSINNLMYAYIVGNLEGKNIEVNEIINRRYWMNPQDVSAYSILGDKNQAHLEKAEDIMDREENLIKAEKIDGVSNDINEDFSTLINIEMGIKHEEY